LIKQAYVQQSEYMSTINESATLIMKPNDVLIFEDWIGQIDLNMEELDLFKINLQVIDLFKYQAQSKRRF
jgi:hypothetical protein